jgi:hypothetical protein
LIYNTLAVIRNDKQYFDSVVRYSSSLYAASVKQMKRKTQLSNKTSVICLAVTDVLNYNQRISRYSNNDNESFNISKFVESWSKILTVNIIYLNSKFKKTCSLFEPVSNPLSLCHTMQHGRGPRY